MESTLLTDNVTLHILPSRQAFAERIAADVAAQLRKDIESRGKATLIVSGGSTPAEFFKILSGYDLPWNKIFISLADDRWLPVTDPESTEKMVRELLLHTESTFIALVNKAESPEEGEAETHRNMLALPRPFSVTVLGMGDDGHCASLFPNNAALKKAFDKNYNRLVVAVPDAPKPPPARITMSYSALIETSRIVIHLLGQSKLDALKHEVLQDGPMEDMPIRAFLRQTKVPVDIYYAE